MDGVAVASAVLSHVVNHVGCCGIFATHYHVLADAWAHTQNQVSVKHMACEVENKPDDPVPKVWPRVHAQPGGFWVYMSALRPENPATHKELLGNSSTFSLPLYSLDTCARTCVDGHAKSPFVR